MVSADEACVRPTMSEASRNFLGALEGLMECFQQEQRGLCRDLKLTTLQFLVLRWLAKDGDANMSKLAQLLGVRPQTVTPIVDSLETGGWVRRVHSTEDRRESFLRLTPKGLRVIQSVRVSFFDKLGRALDEASPTSLAGAANVLEVATAALRRDLARARTTSAKPTSRRAPLEHRVR